MSLVAWGDAWESSAWATHAWASAGAPTWTYAGSGGLSIGAGANTEYAPVSLGGGGSYVMPAPRRRFEYASAGGLVTGGAALTAWEPVPVQAFAVLTLARLPQPGGAARVEHYDHGAAIARDDRDFLDLMEI